MKILTDESKVIVLLLNEEFLDARFSIFVRHKTILLYYLTVYLLFERFHVLLCSINLI